jgi:hypothetical protein
VVEEGPRGIPSSMVGEEARAVIRG